MEATMTGKTDPHDPDRTAHGPGQQPLPARPERPGAEKANTYGESEAPERPEGGKTKYDVPAKGADDFATDELRDKRIRGNESVDDDHQKRAPNAG
jgi:hypothetical protein